MRLQFINHDVREVLASHGKALAGKNEWAINVKPGENFIIVKMSGNPLREVDQAEVISWSINGRDFMSVITEYHQSYYHQAYMDALHVMITPLLKRI